MLIEQGVWSQYLEVGIGPDAEVFTKAPVLSAVGTGMDAGLHPKSAWNNPEPEVVLVVAPDGRITGATLGNDVNLRDFEGRSALLLSQGEGQQRAPAPIGPFVRFFDAASPSTTCAGWTSTLEVDGPDGFRLEGRSSIAEISRDPADLVAQTVSAEHQYPDGFVLFLGTMFAPDRGPPRPRPGLHACARRPGNGRDAEARQAGQPHAGQRCVRALARSASSRS